MPVAVVDENVRRARAAADALPALLISTEAPRSPLRTAAHFRVTL